MSICNREFVAPPCLVNIHRRRNWKIERKRDVCVGFLKFQHVPRVQHVYRLIIRRFQNSEASKHFDTRILKERSKSAGVDKKRNRWTLPHLACVMETNHHSLRKPGEIRTHEVI